MLSTSPELAHRALDAAPDAMIILDEDGIIRFANRQVSTLFGYGMWATLLGRYLAALDVPEGAVGRDLLPRDRLAVDDDLDGHRPRIADAGALGVPVRLLAQGAGADLSPPWRRLGVEVGGSAVAIFVQPTALTAAM